MDKLRMPFFIVALVLAVLIVAFEIGANWFPKGERGTRSETEQALRRIDPDTAEKMKSLPPDQLGPNTPPTPPGSGIPDMAFLDGLMLLNVSLMAASFLLTDRLIGRIQGIIALIVSLLTLIFSIFRILTTLATVLLMIALFVAAPFGTIAYFAKWGFFDRGGASAVLGTLLVLKLAFAFFLILAHQRFVQNKGLVLLIITSLVANLVVGFLHGFVPIFLVSITDGIAAIIVLILAAIWAIVILIGAIIAVIKAIA